MNNLLQIANIQDTKLKTYMSKIVGEHISKLSSPCYFPPYEKEYHEILHLVGLTEYDIKTFVKQFYPQRLAKDYILKDSQVNLLMLIMHYCLLKKNEITFLHTMIYLGIRFYSNILKRHLPKYCDPDVFKYTLDNLNKTHLFSREKTIANAIFYLAKEGRRRYVDDLIKFDDPERISKFVYEYRHKLSQSTKSFANLYYKLSEEGKGFKQPFEGEQGELQTPELLERGQRIVEHITQKITVYKHLDNKALENAKSLTRVSSDLANVIVKELTDLRYGANIKLILELFIRDLKRIEQLCKSDFFDYLRSLMGIRRTNAPVYFKQQVILLLEEIIKNTGHKKVFSKLTPQTKFQTSLFLAYYISMYVRNTVCGL
jgi:hypothetical protein